MGRVVQIEQVYVGRRELVPTLFLYESAADVPKRPRAAVTIALLKWVHDYPGVVMFADESLRFLCAWFRSESITTLPGYRIERVVDVWIDGKRQQLLPNSVERFLLESERKTGSIH